MLLADALSAADTADKADLIAIFEADCRNDNQVARTIEPVSYTHLDVYKRQCMATISTKSTSKYHG